MNIIESKKTYIHYPKEEGRGCFIKELFLPVTNRLGMNKPRGGFWASPVDSDFGWKKWCEDEDFRECDDADAVKFTLKPGSKVLYIKESTDLKDCPIDYESMGYAFYPSHPPKIINIDYEKLAKRGIDAVEVDHSKDYVWMHEYFYTWDCDSIVVLNPEVIEVLNVS